MEAEACLLRFPREPQPERGPTSRTPSTEQLARVVDHWCAEHSRGSASKCEGPRVPAGRVPRNWRRKRGPRLLPQTLLLERAALKCVRGLARVPRASPKLLLRARARRRPSLSLHLASPPPRENIPRNKANWHRVPRPARLEKRTPVVVTVRKLS